VVAGGAGRRFGQPKQFLPLAGQPVAARSVAGARAVAEGVVLVVPAGSMPGPCDGQRRAAGDGTADPGLPETGADRVVAGGATRAESVRAGLAAVPDDADIIVVHDAARPLASSSLFAAVVDAVRAGGVDGAIPVLPVADTLKRVTGGTVQSTVDREGLVAVQTPQAFVASTLRSAHRSGDEASDDASLVEAMGATVGTVSGEAYNVKLTRPEDLALAEAMIRVTEGTGR
jgi:2-C-methyl-D-erythritol 4-phosphate cytidylyltransferase